VRTLRTLVNELLSLTAIQTGNFLLKRTAIDLGALVGEAAEAFRERAAEKGLSLEVSPAEEALQVLADRDALISIVSNLVENAVKYNPEKGRVRVRTGREGIYVTVSVRDDGIGIASEEQAKVFEEFYRVRGEQTAAIPGTGLGLSLVKRLAELHEGR